MTTTIVHGNQTNNNGNSTRPESFYDNFLDNVNVKSKSEYEMNNKELRFDKTPTQAHCLNTTVPQNIAAQNIAGKHTPTRNSLRHSRMIVLNRNGKVPTKYLPALIRYNKLSKMLVYIVTIIGLFISFISVWLILWSPNIRHVDNPYWSAVPVLLSGIIGLVFLHCCPKEYPSRKLSCWYHSVKVFSITISIIAVVTATIVFILGILHVVLLTTMTCSTPDHLNTTCKCKVNDTVHDNNLLLYTDSYHYVDLNCYEVENILKILIIVSNVLNLIAVILLVIYLVLHWKSRCTYDRFVYSSVQTNDDSNEINYSINNNTSNR